MHYQQNHNFFEDADIMPFMAKDITICLFKSYVITTTYTLVIFEASSIDGGLKLGTF